MKTSQSLPAHVNRHALIENQNIYFLDAHKENDAFAKKGIFDIQQLISAFL